MPIDILQMAPFAREKYLHLGRQFGSTDTINQASKTLNACDKYLDVLKLHGFGLLDKQRLHDAREALIQAGVDRSTQVGQQKVTNKSLGAALIRGKEVRQSARSILHNGQNQLLDHNALAEAREVETTLEQTRMSQDEPEKLATQLDLLRKTLSSSSIAAIVLDNGGPQACVELETCADALRQTAEGKAAAGTTAATETIDILDGIIVTLARSARRAARAAARKLRQPALADAFELSYLYDKRSTAEQPDPAPVAPPTTP